jgi:hypothetical protein
MGLQHAMDVDPEMDDDEDVESGKRLVDPGESIASAQEFMKYAARSVYVKCVTVPQRPWNFRRWGRRRSLSVRRSPEGEQTHDGSFDEVEVREIRNAME